MVGLVPVSLFIDEFGSGLRSGGSEAAWGRADVEPRLESDRVGERASSFNRRPMSLSLRGCSHRGSLSRRPLIFLLADSFLQARSASVSEELLMDAGIEMRGSHLRGTYPGAASGDLTCTTSMIFWRGSVV